MTKYIHNNNLLQNSISNQSSSNQRSNQRSNQSSSNQTSVRSKTSNKKMLKCNYRYSKLSTDFSTNVHLTCTAMFWLPLGIRVPKAINSSAQSLTMTLKVGF